MLLLFCVLVLLTDLWKITNMIISEFMYLTFFSCKDDNGYKRLLNGCGICEKFPKCQFSNLQKLIFLSIDRNVFNISTFCSTLRTREFFKISFLFQRTWKNTEFFFKKKQENNNWLSILPVVVLKLLTFFSYLKLE